MMDSRAAIRIESAQRQAASGRKLQEHRRRFVPPLSFEELAHAGRLKEQAKMLGAARQESRRTGERVVIPALRGWVEVAR